MSRPFQDSLSRFSLKIQTLHVQYLNIWPTVLNDLTTFPHSTIVPMQHSTPHPISRSMPTLICTCNINIHFHIRFQQWIAKSNLTVQLHIQFQHSMSSHFVIRFHFPFYHSMSSRFTIQFQHSISDQFQCHLISPFNFNVISFHHSISLSNSNI